MDPENSSNLELPFHEGAQAVVHGALAGGGSEFRVIAPPRPTISSRRIFLRNTTSGISDPICNENYHTFALGRDRKFHVCSNFL